MRFRLRTLTLMLWLLLGMLIVVGVCAFISLEFGAGFRDGFLDGMNKDLAHVRNMLRSPLLTWLLILAALYLLAFIPLMWLNAMGFLNTKFFVRLYLPIWLTIGIVGLSLDWLRGNEE